MTGDSARREYIGGEDAQASPPLLSSETRTRERRLQTAEFTATWMRRRANNVYGRPLFLAKIGGVVFAVALAAFLTLADAGAHDTSPDATRPDTIALRMAERRAERRLSDAEASLAVARARRMSALESAAMAPEARARRDSLAAASAEIAGLIERADGAPLVASYRALGRAPAMAGAPRVSALLDSLGDLDKARSELGSSEGADPIFVALTARVGAIGREIETAARARRAEMRRAIDSLTPPPVSGPATDTMPLAVARDVAARARDGATRALAMARLADSAARERAAREPTGLFGVGIGTLVVASAVLAIVTAFALALGIELRWPRIADVAEAEALSGARVLVTVGKPEAAPELQRRAADREAPPSIEQSSDAYRLLYGQLADATFDLTLIAIAGDDPYVTVAIAANLAAISARSGRPTLLMDTDFRVQPVAAMMRVAPSPGVADVLAHRLGWAGAIRSVLVSRGRTIDVLPSGVLGGTLQAVAEEFGAEVRRLTKRYETVVLSASTPGQGTIAVAAGAVGEVVLCLRVGRSTHGAVRSLLAVVESSGARIRGLVLWDREDVAAPAAVEAEKGLSLVS